MREKVKGKIKRHKLSEFHSLSVKENHQNDVEHIDQENLKDIVDKILEENSIPCREISYDDSTNNEEDKFADQYNEKYLPIKVNRKLMERDYSEKKNYIITGVNSLIISLIIIFKQMKSIRANQFLIVCQSNVEVDYVSAIIRKFEEKFKRQVKVMTGPTRDIPSETCLFVVTNANYLYNQVLFEGFHLNDFTLPTHLIIYEINNFTNQNIQFLYGILREIHPHTILLPTLRPNTEAHKDIKQFLKGINNKDTEILTGNSINHVLNFIVIVKPFDKMIELFFNFLKKGLVTFIIVKKIEDSFYVLNLFKSYTVNNTEYEMYNELIFSYNSRLSENAKKKNLNKMKENASYICISPKPINVYENKEREILMVYNGLPYTSNDLFQGEILKNGKLIKSIIFPLYDFDLATFYRNQNFYKYWINEPECFNFNLTSRITLLIVIVQKLIKDFKPDPIETNFLIKGGIYNEGHKLTYIGRKLKEYYSSLYSAFGKIYFEDDKGYFVPGNVPTKNRINFQDQTLYETENNYYRITQMTKEPDDKHKGLVIPIENEPADLEISVKYIIKLNKKEDYSLTIDELERIPIKRIYKRKGRYVGEKLIEDGLSDKILTLFIRVQSKNWIENNINMAIHCIIESLRINEHIGYSETNYTINPENKEENSPKTLYFYESSFSGLLLTINIKRLREKSEAILNSYINGREGIIEILPTHSRMTTKKFNVKGKSQVIEIKNSICDKIESLQKNNFYSNKPVVQEISLVDFIDHTFLSNLVPKSDISSDKDSNKKKTRFEFL